MGRFLSIISVYYVLVLGLPPATTQPSETELSLDACIRIALAQHADAVQQALRVAQSRADLRQSRYNLLPDLGAGASHGWSQGQYIDPTTNLFVTQHLTSGSQWANASLTLFDGLASFQRIAVQGYALKAAAMDELAVKSRLAMQVAAAYIAVLAAQDMVSQVRGQVAVTEERMKRNEVMHGQGAMSPADYYDVKGEYQADLNRLVDAEQQRQQSLVELARLMQQPYQESLRLAPLAAVPLDAGREDAAGLYELALSHIGQVKAADFREQQAQQEWRLSRSAFLPRLGLSGGFQSRYAGTMATSYTDQMRDNLGSFASLSLQVPVFNRFAARTQVAKAKLAAKEASSQATAQRHGLQQDVQAALIDLDAARARYGNIAEQVAQYAESFRIAQLRFDVGDIHALEYLTAKNRTDNAEINLIVARYQWHLRQFVVDFYRGEKDYLMHDATGQ